MAIPDGTIVIDIVTKTTLGRRRNRLYYTNDVGAPDTADKLTIVANGILGHHAPVWAEVMDESVIIERAEARYYGGAGVDVEATSNIAGTAGEISLVAEGDGPDEAVMPDEVSLIIRVQTGKGGRSKRGRRFITGLSEAVNTHGHVNEDYKAKCIAIAGAIPQDVEIDPAALPDGGSYGGTFHARHYDRKNNVLEPITKAWALDTLGTRRDRRKPLELDVLTI